MRCTCDHRLLRQSILPARAGGPPPFHRCSTCGSLVAVLIFFLEDEPLRHLRGRLLQGYAVAEFYVRGHTLTGRNMAASIALAAAKSGRPLSAHRRRLGVAAIVLASAVTFCSHKALADENGVSFWISGTFGSLASTRAAGSSVASGLPRAELPLRYYRARSKPGGPRDRSS